MGGVRRRPVFFAPVGLLPAGQDGHAVLLAQGFVWRSLPGFYLLAQVTFLLNHLHHGAVPTCPGHWGHLMGGKGETMLVHAELALIL